MIPSPIGSMTDDLDTPALLLDLEAFEANAATMAGHLRERGVAWRPHAKALKCPALVHRLLRAVGQRTAERGPERRHLGRAADVPRADALEVVDGQGVGAIEFGDAAHRGPVQSSMMAQRSMSGASRQMCPCPSSTRTVPWGASEAISRACSTAGTR